ncbi:MAG: Rieske (2Fe-2S) protein [Arenicellales bacterium]
MLQKNLLCRSEELDVGGTGLRFEVQKDGEKRPAFAVRSTAGISAFLNRCGHRDLELDWSPGEFFDLDARLLICATHGALYDPQSGACKGGPCNGVGLRPLSVTEEAGLVYLIDVNYSLVLNENP